MQNNGENSHRGKVVYIATYGCQMNARDSEVITGLLKRAGHELINDEGAADVIIFNTCSVRQHAEDKVWSEIGRIAKAKRGQRKRGQSPEKGGSPLFPLIGIVGCMAQNYKEGIFQKAPAVDFVVGTSDIHRIPEIIKEVTGCRSPVAGQNIFEKKIWETDGLERPEDIYHTGFYEDRDHAYVVISEGCSNHCSYCVVPFVRGELRNRDYKAIIKEIQEAVEKGIAKITLLGQNVNAYKCSAYSVERIADSKELNAIRYPLNAKTRDFIELLKMINDIKGLMEFSFITSHPKDTSVELFEAMAACERLKKHLHLPVQSGSDRILEMMNRGYTAGQYLGLVKDYRRIVPGGTISTDVIVGFPTENEEDFLATFNLMKEADFNSAYLFKYSPRPNTNSGKLPDDVPKEEKERRHKTLLNFQKDLHVKRRGGKL